MIKFLNRELNIFGVWLVYIVYRKPINQEGIQYLEEIKNKYKWTPRQVRIMERVIKINKSRSETPNK